jgi:CHAT domain-containing protein/tetratricopeptide (TPR) repeat protein
MAGLAVPTPLRRAWTQGDDPSLLLASGNYDAAEAAAGRLLAAARERFGPESRQSAEAGDALVEALWRNGRWTPATLDLAERIVALKRSRLSDSDPGVATSVRNLGRLMLSTGDAAAAISQFEQVASVARENGNPLDEAAAGDDLAVALLEAGRHDEAAERIQESLRRKQAAVGSEDPRLAATLEIQARIFIRIARFADARPPLERAIAIRERAHPIHPDTAAALATRADLLWFEGDLNGSRDVAQRALGVGEQTLRPGHPDIAALLRTLAAPVAKLGEFGAALQLRARAREIVESALGESHPMVAGYLNDLAISYVLAGDYSRARTLYERALSVYERNHGSLDGAATFTHNLADVSGRLGDYDSAAKYELRAIALWTQAFGAEHPFVATGVTALAEIRLAQRRSLDALKLLRRALAVRERMFGPVHLEVARTLTQLASAYVHVGAVPTAETLSARAVQIWESSDARNSLDFANALSTRGDALTAAGDHLGARQLYGRALDLLLTLAGPDHRTVAEARVKVAASLAALHENSSALSEALEGERVAREHLRATVRYLSERQALAYATSRSKGLDVALSILLATPRQPGAVVSVLDAAIRARAVVFDEMAERHRTAANYTDERLAPLWRHFLAAQQRVANLSVAGLFDRPEQFRRVMDEAVVEKDRAERALAERSASFRERFDLSNVGLAEIRAALPAGTALVTYVRYGRRLPSAKGAARTIASYMAFIVPADASGPAAVSLGTADRIDQTIDAWRSSLAAGAAGSTGSTEEELRVAGGALRRLVWDPVAVHLAAARRVLIVPDGTINLLNFAALPSPAGYLVEAGRTLHYLSAERDVLQELQHTPRGSGMLAMGGATFDGLLGAAATTRTLPAGPKTPDCSSLQTARFDPLPGTRQEAVEIAHLWTRTDAGSVEVLTAGAASEGAFKAEAPGRRVLHLATHGFFLDGSCGTTAAGSRAVGGLVGVKVAAGRPNEQNPLLLAGLAFAGANRRGSGPADQDGILTAEEVAGLPLQGIEWAVLSACDTALGEIRAGEGVFGLRRAFQIAGARTVIMSLWSVGDEPTRRWMRALYENRLVKHLDTADAVRDANLTVLRERRAQGLSTHPFYWAGFVAAGDWR